MSATIVQYSVQWLIDQVTKLDARAKQQEQVVRAQRVRVNALKANAEKITDAAKRLEARAVVARTDAKQKKLESNWNAFVAKYKSMRDSAIGWMRTNGLLKGTTLGELGVVPFVPLILGATVVAIVVSLEQFVLASKAQEADIARDEKAFVAYTRGEITPEQYRQVTATPAAGGGQKPDPLGLTSFAEALVPIGLIVLGIVVAPKLLKQFESRERKAVHA